MASKNAKAPITVAQRRQLEVDAKNVKATADRKGLTLDRYEEKRETAMAKNHFELGCWLFYYSQRVGSNGAEGLKDRIECALRLFLAGIFNPSYDFITVFDFGERQFDTIFEMGDATQVKDGLRQRIPSDSTGKLVQAFDYHGWNIESA